MGSKHKKRKSSQTLHHIKHKKTRIFKPLNLKHLPLSLSKETTIYLSSVLLLIVSLVYTAWLPEKQVATVPTEEFLSKEQIKTYSKPHFDGFTILVDQKKIGLLKSEAEADGILNDLRVHYNNPTGSNGLDAIYFKEKVKVVKSAASVGAIGNYSAPESLFKTILRGTDARKIHLVEEGESFWSIAMDNGLSEKQLVAANPKIKPELLQIGDEIDLLVKKPLITVCTLETVTYNDVIPSQVEYIENKTMFVGQSKTKVEGTKGKKEVVAQVITENGIPVYKKVLKETILKKSTTKVVVKGTKEKPRTDASGVFAKPVSRGSFSSPFGWRWGRKHTGTDISMSVGTDVKAADGGKVIKAATYGAYGKCVIIDHGNGYQTYYAHLNAYDVQVGDKVYKGQKIAESGNTGRSTGPHLHFEIRKNGTPQNPEKYVDLR